MNPFYKYESMDVYRLLTIDENAEIEIKSLIDCSASGDPEPRGSIWLPRKSYRFNSNAEGVATVEITRKVTYRPLNPEQSSVAFLTSGKNYKLTNGLLRVRTKRSVNLLSILSFVISLIALGFTWITYKEQRYELDISKRPVWLTQIERKAHVLSFRSPREEIQLQYGFFSFSQDRDIPAQALYMPDMSVSLALFSDFLEKHFQKIPREKFEYRFGANKIFEPVSVVTTYTYKGELRHIGAIYNIFFDLIIPKESRKKEKIKVEFLGASFVRFFAEGENLRSALANHLRNEPTDPEEWLALISGSEPVLSSSKIRVGPIRHIDRKPINYCPR